MILYIWGEILNTSIVCGLLVLMWNIWWDISINSLYKKGRRAGTLLYLLFFLGFGKSSPSDCLIACLSFFWWILELAFQFKIICKRLRSKVYCLCPRFWWIAWVTPSDCLFRFYNATEYRLNLLQVIKYFMSPSNDGRHWGAFNWWFWGRKSHIYKVIDKLFDTWSDWVNLI